MKIKGNYGEYEVGEVVFKGKDFNLRNSTDGDGKPLLLQVALNSEGNAGLALSAFMLDRMNKDAEEVEEAWKDKGKETSLNYQLGFPKIRDFVMLESQGNRRVNVIEFNGPVDLTRTFALPQLERDGLMIDLRTSAWMLGKALKTLQFAHDGDVSIGKITESNFLIEPDEHYIIVLDWSKADSSKILGTSVVRDEIKRVATLILKHTFTNDASIQEAKYVNWMKQLSQTGSNNALDAHANHYKTVWSLTDDPECHWERGFYDFTTVPRGS